jgi:ribosomal protein S18 acetylase RimI-like enzyme
MPEIEIRPASEKDIESLVEIDHHYFSDHVWQIEFQNSYENEQISVNFRQVHLPRLIKVDYPRPRKFLQESWSESSGILAASYNEQVVGYIRLLLNKASNTTWVSDLAVAEMYRRQGIGSTLVLAAIDWANQMETHNLVLEMQPKNYPAIQMAKKLGFEFSGFSNRYYANHETGLFFCKALY